MNLKPIKTEADYQEALQEIERLFEVESNTPEWEKLDILTTLVDAYEKQNYPIDSPTPIESLLYYFESRNQGFSDFINGLKSRGVSEEIINNVLNDLSKTKVSI
jgi:HTH-type transcriptional regulator / antitoxin HigA